MSPVPLQLVRTYSDIRNAVFRLAITLLVIGVVGLTAGFLSPGEQ